MRSWNVLDRREGAALEHTDTDAEAVARSLAGRPEAFAALVRRHGQAVHAYLSRRSGRQTADDLLGEVWLRAFRSRQSYDRSWPNARPWLYGIAGNTLRAHWRCHALEDIAGAEPVQDPWSEVDGRLEADRMRPQLRRALASLSPQDRDVLLLVAWEQLSPSEAATALGIPPGTARWRLHRARALLQEHFDRSAESPLLPISPEA